MNNQDFLAKLLILSTVKRKETVSSSYFFSQLFSALGITLTATELIDDLTGQNLLTHEGRFEGTSGLIKNISLTVHGIDFVVTHPIHTYSSQYILNFGQSELLTILLAV